MTTKHLIIVALAVSIAGVHAQTTQQPEENIGQPNSQLEQPAGQSAVQSPQTGAQINEPINEPSGAQSQSGKTFSTDSPPPSQPSQESVLQPGQPLRESSGAQPESPQPQQQEPVQPQAPQTESSAPGAEQQQQQPGATGQPGQSQSAQPRQQETLDEPAGAQRNQSQQLAIAFESNQKMQIERAIKATVTSTKVPDEFVTRLSSDVSTVLTSVQLEPGARVRLADAIHVILNAQPASQAEVQRAYTTVQSILLPGGRIATPMAQAALCDLHLIATQLVPGLQLDMSGAKVRLE